MTTILANRPRCVGLALSLCVMWVSGLAVAQQAPRPAPPIPAEQKVGKSPDPRNFEGVWFTGGYDRTYRQLDRSEPPFNAATRKEWLRHIQAEKDGTPIGDAPTRCYPHGVPRLVASPYPVQFIQTPGLITILHEVSHNIRYVHMNQKPPANVKPSFLGYSVGHWEEDTLVIETTALNTRTRIDEEGIVHSDKLKVTEYIRKIEDGQRIEDIIHIEDPGSFIKPWDARRYFNWRPDLHLTEYICEENNRNVPNESGFTTAK